MISYTLSKEQFLQFQAAFRARANAKQIGGTDIVVYNLVRGKPVDRGFTPITNETKLNNGARYWNGFIAAKNFATHRLYGPKKNEHFKQLYSIELTEEQFATFLEILKEAQ